MYGLLDFWWPQFGKLIFKYACSNSNVTWLLFSKEAYLFKEKHSSAMQFYLNNFTQKFNGDIATDLIANETGILGLESRNSNLISACPQQIAKIIGSSNFPGCLSSNIAKIFGLNSFHNVIKTEQIKIQNLRHLYSHKVGEYDGLLNAISSSLYFMMFFYNQIEKDLHNITIKNSTGDLSDLGDDRFVPWINFLSKFMCGLIFDYALLQFSKDPTMHNISAQYYLVCAASELSVEKMERIVSNLYHGLHALVIIFDKTSNKIYELTKSDYWEIRNHINIVRNTWQNIPKVSDIFSAQYELLFDIKAPELKSMPRTRSVSLPIAIPLPNKSVIKKTDSDEEEFNLRFSYKPVPSMPTGNVNVRVESVEKLDRNEALHLSPHKKHDHNESTIAINNGHNKRVLPRRLHQKSNSMYFSFSSVQSNSSLVKTYSHSIESGVSTDAGNSSPDSVELPILRALTAAPAYVDVGVCYESKGPPNSLPDLTGHNRLSLRFS